MNISIPHICMLGNRKGSKNKHAEKCCETQHIHEYAYNRTYFENFDFDNYRPQLQYDLTIAVTYFPGIVSILVVDK